jgi:hypothetical protein
MNNESILKTRRRVGVFLYEQGLINEPANPFPLTFPPKPISKAELARRDYAALREEHGEAPI